MKRAISCWIVYLDQMMLHASRLSKYFICKFLKKLGHRVETLKENKGSRIHGNINQLSLCASRLSKYRFAISWEKLQVWS